MIETLRSRANIAVVIAGIAGILGVLYAWRLPPFTSAVVTTDNAYVKGFVTTLAPQVSGSIAQVSIKDFQRVKQGQTLFVIEDRIFQQKLAQATATLDVKKATLANSYQQEAAAQAQLASAQAALHKAELNWRRIEPLTQRGVATQSDADAARATLEQTQAALDQAKANLRTILTGRQGLTADVEGAQAAVQLAQIDLEHTKIIAPLDGQAGEVGARLGQYVVPGTQLVAIVPDEVWIIANYKETQLDHMKVGQPATFTVDALGGMKMTGHVSRFSPAAGSEFSVLKPDNATGNFTKVAQRIPVRIDIDPGQEGLHRLIPGMSVITRVDTGAAGTQAVQPKD
ncbi:MAG: Hemolysin secretion protein D [Candidatus Tokpelaia hoelldobleri]|uniref:Hemolysin secretion protein D n=1 Tax=Candidatus Tokpelaia hoelldobleri TaxID=1902579 RepID=A0A1U9JSK3_9HYPH|nr:MAG: Hemolysin secretion protein D [Candidatus Tokpelaia hoelldoblerii]